MNASWARRTVVAAVVGAMILAESARIEATELPSNTSTIGKADPRTFATIFVNGEQRGEQIVLVKSDGVYASLAGLRASGLVIPLRLEGGGVESYVNIKDLAPEIVA